MIGEVLPDGVAASEAFTDPPAAALFPEERAAVAQVVTKRRREFTTVRVLARQALAQLGVRAMPILPGRRGAPVWPDGVVGSMTHCDGYRAAAVAHRDALTSIGIDAEPHAPLPAGVRELVTLTDERDALRDRELAAPGICWDRLLFSAKESAYKTWFPLTHRWLDFSEATVRFQLDAAGDRGQFTVHLLVPPPLVAGRELTGFTGRWLARRGLLLTAITMPALPAAPGGARSAP